VMCPIWQTKTFHLIWESKTKPIPPQLWNSSKIFLSLTW
jgi:hypothetical protein